MAEDDRQLRQFRFCIDRGGTFTDIYAEVPGEPGWRVVKLLSVDPTNYEDAPREGIRRILEEVTDEKIPRSAKLPTERIDWIRMGEIFLCNLHLQGLLLSSSCVQCANLFVMSSSDMCINCYILSDSYLSPWWDVERSTSSHHSA
jgi:hypothetical protein